jgi:hypothetical protein
LRRIFLCLGNNRIPFKASQITMSFRRQRTKCRDYGRLEKTGEGIVTRLTILVEMFSDDDDDDDSQCS